MNSLRTTVNHFFNSISRSLGVGSCLALLVPAIYLAGCGGGNSTAGIDGSGAPVVATSGTVNGFGSVIVNGVRYHSDKANVSINGEAANENSLRTGYQVRVTGTLNSDGTGNADSIEFSPTLVGAIAEIDMQNERLVLLQQTVQITNATLFDIAIEPNNLSGLSLGTVILVSGQRNSEGLIAATRIELAPQSSQQLLGSITAIDLANHTFKLNDLTVNYSAASVKNTGTGPLVNGLHVNVTGNLDSQGVLKASTVSVQTINFSSSVKTADVEGFITRFVSDQDFDVAGIKCLSYSATLYINGSGSDLALGSSVKVSGDINAAGALVAKKIEFRQRVINEINGEVSSVSTPIGGAIATGSFIIAGTTIQTNSSTVYEDGSNDRLRRFNFSDIRQGNFLKVSGYTLQNSFIATKIERRIFSSDHELRFQGLVTQVGNHSFTVYNQTIVIDINSELRSATGASLSEAEFLSQALSQEVRVRVILRNGILVATSADIKDQWVDDFHHPRDGGGPRDGGPQEDGPPNGGSREAGSPQGAPHY